MISFKSIFINPLKYLFKKRIRLPKERDIYGVITGDYVGECFVFINKSDNKYHILSLPKMKKYHIDEKIVENGIKKGILEFIKVLPKGVYNVCKAEYYHKLKRKRKKEK